MSPLRSAPQTLQRLRLSLDPKVIVRPREGTSTLLLRDLPSESSASASASALSCAIRSASRARSSASGESGMVSRLEMLGLRERADVGVEGIDDRLLLPPPPLMLPLALPAEQDSREGVVLVE